MSDGESRVFIIQDSVDVLHAIFRIDSIWRFLSDVPGVNEAVARRSQRYKSFRTVVDSEMLQYEG